jgi:hypothetical protein
MWVGLKDMKQVANWGKKMEQLMVEMMVVDSVDLMAEL